MILHHSLFVVMILINFKHNAHFAQFSLSLVYFFTPQGGHIHTKALDSSPDSMTVMDIRSRASWDLCVTLPNTRKISLMGVTPSGVNIKVSMYLKEDILLTEIFRVI